MIKTKTFTVGEIKIRYKPRKVLNAPNMVSSQEVYNVLVQFFKDEIMALQEQFVVLYLNQANKLIGFYCMSTGGLTGTVADIRLILAVGLKTNCTQLIVAHNHPSGNLTASSADKELTRKLKEAAAVMDIKLLDHLIVVPSGNYLSFSDEGLI
jgi:DNA repair protein RadC